MQGGARKGCLLYGKKNKEVKTYSLETGEHYLTYTNYPSLEKLLNALCKMYNAGNYIN